MTRPATARWGGYIPSDKAASRPFGPGAILQEVAVFSQQNIAILPANPFGGGDKIVLFLQLPDDLEGGLIVRLPALRVEFGEDGVETDDADLRIVRECEQAPVNYRLGGDSPVLSPLVFIKHP